MRKFLLYFLIIIFMFSSVSYAEDDDSTPYMPYSETPPAPQTPKAAPKKSSPKKNTKKTTTKKTTTKKSAPKPAPKPSSLQQGINLMQQEKYEQAKSYLLKAIQEDRNNPNVWYWYGVYHEKTGGFYQAQYFYSKAVTIDPAFEPLSRVVYYPEDNEKTPLWDPKRPARVYPVEVAQSGGGLTTVPPGVSKFPTAPNDPELPHVPVYTPPEPDSNPFDGDAWSPAVYVPPSPEEIQSEGEHSPVYLPPQAGSIIAQNSTTARQVLEVPVYQYPRGQVQTQAKQDDIIRADKPLYNPPEPGQKIQTPPKSQTQKKQSQPQKTNQTVTKKSSTQTQTKTSTVPNNRVVRQSQKPKKASTTTTKTQTRKPQTSTSVSRDVKPQTQTQKPAPQTQTQTQTKAPEPITIPPEPEVRVQRNNEANYPPVGQQAADPGTIPDVPYPPVGQGNQN